MFPSANQRWQSSSLTFIPPRERSQSAHQRIVNSSRATTARNFKRRPTLSNTNKAHLVRSLPQETRVPKKPRRRCLSPNESFPLFPSLSTDSESLRTGMETVSTRPHSHPASVGEPGDVHEWPRHLPSSSSAVQAALITRR